MNSPFNVYAVKRPTKRNWTFERVTFLPSGGISIELVQVMQRTYKEACKERDAYNAPGVMCGVLYKV